MLYLVVNLILSEIERKNISTNKINISSNLDERKKNKQNKHFLNLKTKISHQNNLLI